MDTTKDQQSDKDFPGYPHYPAKEDITQPSNNNGEVHIDAGKTDKQDTSLDGDLDIVMGTEADVTPEEQELLASTEGYNRVDGRDDDDELLNEDDLDIPGADADDANEAIGEEDEENNYYSLGDTEDVEEPNEDLR